MRALKFFETGSLDNLRVEEVASPKPAAGEALGAGESGGYQSQRCEERAG